MMLRIILVYHHSCQFHAMPEHVREYTALSTSKHHYYYHHQHYYYYYSTIKTTPSRPPTLL